MSTAITFWHKHSVKGGKAYNMEVNIAVTDGTVMVIGASLHNLGGRYVGWWDVDQMPKALVKELRTKARDIMMSATWLEPNDS